MIPTIVFQFLAVSTLFQGVTPIETHSYDGSGNNIQNPAWGKTKTARIRSYPPLANFYDASGTPVDETNSNLPSARRVMEELFRVAKPHQDKTSNHLMLEFGHFIVQDTMGSSYNNDTEPFPVPCDGNLGDYVFCPVTGMKYPANLTTMTIAFHRKEHVPSDSFPRATLNGMTSFLDLSNIYGLTEQRVAVVRGGLAMGLLELDEDGLLPRKNIYWDGMNTSPGAFALYVAFMRYHNKMAIQYSAEDPSLSGDEIFALARRKTIAVYQSIVVEKYFPTLIGNMLPTYEGYDETADPSIDEFFATVGFRYAHTSFSGVIRLLDKDYHPTPADPLLLRDVFKMPAPNDVPTVVARYGGIEPFLRGLTVTPGKAIDASIVDDLNLFSEATSVVDVQRGRDVGIPYYNEVREAFNLPRIESLDELAGNDTTIAQALKNLYDGDINKLDAYVGSLVEAPELNIDPMGPLLIKSITDQFTRLRDGDRFWFQNIFTKEEFESFPTLSSLIKDVCEGMDLFPTDMYQLVYDGKNSGSESSSDDAVVDDGDDVCGPASTQLSLLGGGITVGWHVDDPSLEDRKLQLRQGRTIEVTVKANELMQDPGYIGIGWGSQEMSSAEIWFCTINTDEFNDKGTLPDECPRHRSNLGETMFSCCVTPGTLHGIPRCAVSGDDIFYPIEVAESCLTTDTSSVTIRAPVCMDPADDTSPEGPLRNCFRLSSTPNGKMDFIVSYNPMALNRPHGYQRRTSAQVDLIAGALTQRESLVTDTGLLATHGVFMLVAWMIAAPLGIFIVRYMKTRSWRLVAHISIMGFVGSLMVPLLIGVEASVGATDKTAEHCVVGLSLMIVFFFMVFAGRIRYLKLEGKPVGRKTDLVSHIFHKYGGLTIVALAWWNCYTGLVRIGPEDSYIQIVVLSSFPMGYDMNIFGVIRKYVYFPYIAFVGVIFFIAEVRKQRASGVNHTKKLEAIMSGKESIWGDDDKEANRLETMTMAKFLEVTRLGSALCVVDGRVLDITNFMDVHPGGLDLLRYSKGSDITEEVLGRRDVDGRRHTHSPSALKLLKTLVSAVLIEGDESSEFNVIPGSHRDFLDAVHPPGGLKRGTTTQVFRSGRVVGVRYLTPAIELTDKSKPVLLLRVALPRSGRMAGAIRGNALLVPSSAFTFRGSDKQGRTFERQYTPVRIARDLLKDLSVAGDSQRNIVTGQRVKEGDEEVYDFFISLVPGGKMSKYLMSLKPGKRLLVQDPKINPPTIEKVDQEQWKTVVMLAAGTGLSPMLQLIDHYLASYDEEGRGNRRRLFLVWVLKSRKHAYPEAVGLEERARRSNGRFKWVVVYSSTHTSRGLARAGALHNLGGKEDKDNPQKPRSGRRESRWSFRSLDDPKNAQRYRVSQNQRISVQHMIEGANNKRVSENLDDTYDNYDTSLEIDAYFWSRAAEDVSRQCDQFLLGDILSSVQDYVKEVDAKSRNVQGSSMMIGSLVDASTQNDQGSNRTLGSVMATETSSETAPEESPPGPDGGTQGFDASEGRARDTEPAHVYLGDHRIGTVSLIDSADELSLIKKDVEDDDSDCEFSPVPMPLSAHQPASSGTFAREHHPEMLSPQTSDPEPSEPIYGAVPSGSLLPGRQLEMSRPKPHGPERSRPMLGLISGLSNILPNGMPPLPGFNPGGTKRRASSLGLPISREFLLGVISSAQDYVEEADAIGQNVQGSSKMVRSVVDGTTQNDQGSKKTFGSVVTETSSETTPEESPPGPDGGTQGFDASEGQDPDSSEEQAKFPNMLVAISGSPTFEMNMVGTLKKIGLPEKQTVRFHTSSVPL